MMLDGELHGWCRHHPNVEDMTANRLQGSYHDRLKHRTGHPTVPPHADASFSTVAGKRPCAAAGIKFHVALRCQRFPDSPAHAGDTDHQTLISHWLCRPRV